MYVPNEIDQLAATHLGQKGGEGYKDEYDPSLLVFIPRHLNREQYGIKEDNLPFIGWDTWNAYEVSALTTNGLPIAGMLKISYPANSKFHVESKSLKLYLNSFNMTKLGRSKKECIERIEELVKSDLTYGIQAPVLVTMITSNEYITENSFTGFPTLENILSVETLTFDSYKSNKDELLIQYPVLDKYSIYHAHTSLLRSNCRVTGQPDWGDLYITLCGRLLPDSISLLKYIISHRKVNHFHEEIVEMIFANLLEAYSPDSLMVAALYTRRGGIDINPIRSNNPDIIPDWFYAKDRLIKKTLRQ